MHGASHDRVEQVTPPDRWHVSSSTQPLSPSVPLSMGTGDREYVKVENAPVGRVYGSRFPEGECARWTRIRARHSLSRASDLPESWQ